MQFPSMHRLFLILHDLIFFVWAINEVLFFVSVTCILYFIKLRLACSLCPSQEISTKRYICRGHYVSTQVKWVRIMNITSVQIFM